MSKTLLARCCPLLTCLLLVFSALACRRDGSLNGADLPGLSQPDQGSYRSDALVAYSEKTPHINSSAPLFVKTLGVLKSPLFGRLKASFAAQLTLPERDLYFGKNPILDSVVFTAPLLSRPTVKSQDQNPYRNDSIVLRQPDGRFKPFHMKAYEITAGIKHFNSISYSDHYYTLGKCIGELHYIPIQDSLTVKSGGKLKKIPPALWIRLASDKKSEEFAYQYFQKAFLDPKNQIHFVNNANFRSYFRGLYLKAEGKDGSLVSFDGNAARLLIYYRNAAESGLVKAFPVGPTASQVSVYEPDYTAASADLSRQLRSPNKTQGEDRLYLQGMGGARAVVHLLSDQAFQKLKDRNRVVTDARLVVRATAAQTPLLPVLALLDGDDKLIPAGTAQLNPEDHTYTFRIPSYLNHQLRDSYALGALKLVVAKIIKTTDGNVVSQNLPFQALLDGKSGQKPLSFEVFYTALAD